MNPWIRQLLIDRGILDEQGIGRRVQQRRCHRCQARILVALDGDRCAFTATVDPTPLDVHAELQALIAGRRTYNLHPVKGGAHLDPRDRWRIANPDRGIVLPDHACGHQLAPYFHDPPPPAAPADDQPPF